MIHTIVREKNKFSEKGFSQRNEQHLILESYDLIIFMLSWKNSSVITKSGFYREKLFISMLLIIACICIRFYKGLLNKLLQINRRK